MSWIDALPRKGRRGSWPRCLLLMEGERSEVAQRLTNLVGRPDVRIPTDAFWMPKGLPRQQPDGPWDLEPAREAQLGVDQGFLKDSVRRAVTDWWLEVPRGAKKTLANTPNWDIASTCEIEGRPGLLLVEAKAHQNELGRNGKSRPKTRNGRKNDERIRKAVKEANDRLTELRPNWCLSCDRHYQLCNRFAWAWKLASMGVPVVLVYLGFLKAKEMTKPFASHDAWDTAVRKHSHGIAPGDIWGTRLEAGGTPIISLILSAHRELPPDKTPPCP